MYNNSARFREASTVRSLETLKTVDRYVIKNHLLGEGSYAKTYLALNSAQDILACKMIGKKNLIEKINNSKNKEKTRDFIVNSIRNQANTWKMLKHKNIASFKEYAQTENNVYFFIEFCSGGTLQSILNQKRLSQSQALKIFKQIVDGCQYLYDMGVFHRDLKPENIMIHDGKVKIADFGLAKLVEQDQFKNILLQRAYVGTPIYMSPQVLKKQPYSIKCDVWSIGVILYRLLYLSLPWQNFDDLQSLIYAVKSEPKFPPHIVLDPTLKQLVLMMLAYHEKDRISMKEVQTYLEQFIKSG